ncbi:MAG: glutamate--cysteine ligase, partial [Bdellovibrionota bacterium]
MTALTKTLLATQIRKHRAEIARWHLKKIKEAPPPFYSSVDLRDAGFKIVP